MKTANRRQRLRLACAVLLLLATSFTGTASGAGDSDPLTLMLQGLALAWRNPDDDILYNENQGSGAGLVARLIADQRLTATTHIKINVYQAWLPDALAGGATATGARLDVERSSNLQYSWSDSEYQQTTLDQLAATWSAAGLALTAGRQPINLATTFYFTPNDLFAPYAAQAFYRIYKPGVDGLRAEYRLDDLSLVSAYSVLGYRPAAGTANGWSRTPDAARLSHLLRYSAVSGDFDLALLAGKVRGRRLAGVGLQGELFDWLGVRAEMQYARSPEATPGWRSELVAGLEHHFASSLDLRLEFFRHSAGARAAADYAAIGAAPGEPVYLGRHYLATGGSYEITPLLSGQLLLMRNLDDHSQLAAVSGQYSLSDEADMALTLSLPQGKKPDTGVLRSEFAAAPRLLNLELRQFF